MNVLIVTDFFVRGGLETHILGYCQTLQDMGHKVSVVVGNEPRVGPLQEIVGDRVLQVPISTRMSGLDLQNVTEAIVGFGQCHGCDVVHAHPFMSLIVGTIAAAKMRKPYVTTVHGPVCLSNSWGPTYRLFLEGIAFADAFATFCVSKELIRRVRLLQPNGRYHLLPNGVDVARFSDALRDDKGPWALIARLDQDKLLGLKHLLSQFSMATECKIPVHIFGEGEARGELENWLSAHPDHAHIIMKGHTDNLDLELRAGYSGAAGMGRVVLEAGALGLPVILCGYDGIKGLIEPFAITSLQERNFSGRGLPAIDASEFQSQLLGLSQNPQKYNLRPWIVQHANEASIWSDYVKLLSAIPDYVDYEWLRPVNDLLNNLKDSPFLGDDKAANLASVIKRLGRAQENQEGSVLLGELEYAEQAIQLLSARLTDNGLAMRALMAQNAEKEQSVQSTSIELAEKDQTLRALSLEVAEKGQEIQSLLSEIAEKEQVLQTLSSEAAEKEETVELLLSQLAEKERTVQSLSGQLERKDQAVQMSFEALAAKEAELAKITKTLGWRWLTLYGRIKYRYLLPVYRMLGLAPFERKPGTKKQDNHSRIRSGATSNPPTLASKTSVTLEEQASNGIDTQNFDRILDSIFQERSTYDVVCFPIIDWDFRFQRPQQLMSRFASSGHRVFYLSQTFRCSGESYTINEKCHNVYEVSLCGLQRNVYTEALDDRTRDAIFSSLDALRRDLSLGATAAFAQLPFWWPLVDKARAEFAWPIVYDCMDYHAGFSTNKQIMVGQERGLLTSADLVVVSSSFLENEAKRFNSEILLLRNACDYEHFAKASSQISGRPVIGYYGAIADWFDSDLVADLAERRPDWEFVLVGSTFAGNTRRLSKLPNVSLPGEKHYSAIPDWLGTFDVAIIPFKRMPLTEATNPVKAYEILASGKPLVSVPIPEMVSLAPMVRLASTVEEFEREISEALKPERDELIEKRRAFAKEHTWEKRFETLSAAVPQTFSKASLIIVTFNNLDLNRLCLGSLYARTEWPNFEVIVVDNASADGTPEYLLEAEKSFPNLRVILNEKNLGFAAANNIGLRQATGEYLVLLNNDTVLTHGWLSALIRHLHADPRIGLIGPVTNAIANEAKVEVGYEQIDDMESWAASFTRENDGQVFPIPMLAMFCVAMRREVFEKVGLLDERFEVGMFEDDDYCRRVREWGYELRCARDSFVHHWQLASFRLIGGEEYLRIYEANQKRYQTKWAETPNLPGLQLQRRTVDSNYREQLEQVIARIQNSKGAVTFLPSIGWNVHLFQRPHHLAQTFARSGYVSIFDSSNAHDEVKGFKEIEPNLFLFNGPEDALHKIPNPIIWTFPYNFDRTEAFPKPARSIYDWIDALEVFPYDRAFLERNHSRALKTASVVACVSRKLHNEAIATRPDAIYLPNGVEYERFANDKVTIPDDPELDGLRSEGKPVAGYYGALAEWFDYELLGAVAHLRPDWNFLLIGQKLDRSLDEHPILTLPNVSWIGPRPYRALPGYLRLFDVAMIPFVINNITLATSPLKLYEYLAAGKPVIATPMPECLSFSDVHVVHDANEFSKALDAARCQGVDKDFQTHVRALASGHSWEARVQAAIDALDC